MTSSSSRSLRGQPSNEGIIFRQKSSPHEPLDVRKSHTVLGTCTYTCIYMYVYIYIYNYMHVSMYYVYVCIFILTYIHIVYIFRCLCVIVYPYFSMLYYILTYGCSNPITMFPVSSRRTQNSCNFSGNMWRVLPSVTSSCSRF